MPIPLGLDPKKVHPRVKESSEPIMRFFSWHDAHPLALWMVLFKRYGEDIFDYDNDALYLDIIEDFNATAISDLNWQKIQAFLTLLSSTAPWKEWEVFENIIQALNNNMPDPRLLQKATVAQLMAGIDMINDVRNDEKFDDEIWKYVAACALDDGIPWVPEPLTKANFYLEERYFMCPTCDYRIEIEPDRQKCIESYDTEFPLNNEGTPKNCPFVTGEWVKLTRKKRDGTAIRKKFEEWKGLDSIDFDSGSVVELPAARLVVAHSYVNYRRKQLVEQLEALEYWVKD